MKQVLKHPISAAIDMAERPGEGLLVGGVYGGAGEGSGGLQRGDLIISVNGISMKGLQKNGATAIWTSALEAQKTGSLDVVVLRPSENARGAAGARSSGGEDGKSVRKAGQERVLLPLPPKSIKLVLWDMDNTLLRMHTKGVWFDEIDQLVPAVTPAFSHLVPRLLREGFQVGVVTFSDANLAKQYRGRNGKGGADLVCPLLRLSFEGFLKRAGRPEKEAKVEAAKLVESIYVVGALPHYRNEYEEEFKRKNMPVSKQWHIERVKDMIAKRSPGSPRVKNKEIIFFDDSQVNAAVAEKDGVNAVWVNPSDAFTVSDWMTCIVTLQTRENASKTPGNAVSYGDSKGSTTAPPKPQE